LSIGAGMTGSSILPCGRHIMHFIEIEFLQCRHANQKHEVRGKEDDDSGNSVP